MFDFLFQGFEWNKYNQTHYDMDNPPPKIVQGYKFNVSITYIIVGFILLYYVECSILAETSMYYVGQKKN